MTRAFDHMIFPEIFCAIFKITVHEEVTLLINEIPLKTFCEQ